MQKGHLHTYTGNGKGKTTSAVGLALRAKSRGMNVLFAQFMKPAQGGETELLKTLGIKVIRFEHVLSPHFYPEADMKKVRQETLKALTVLTPMLKQYDMIVLDEFNHLVAQGFISDEEARQFIVARPERLELVVTGREAPGWLIDLSDYVSKIVKVKHPASEGVDARKGIEY